MTPRQFLKRYRKDDRATTGSFFSTQEMHVEAGEKVGVVLFSLGGPAQRSEVDHFLYRRWMDPVLQPFRVRGGRHYLMRMAARVGAHVFWKDYEQIGGECPINRLTREQAAALQERLNACVGPGFGITFRTYIAMRYGSPSSEDAFRRMQTDGVTSIILLPLYPQYSIATTGSSLAYWSVMTESNGSGNVPTTAVLEYATHPGYVEAISDRIDQALQRVPRRLRRDTHIVFSAEQPSLGGNLDREVSFCGHVLETVRAVGVGREAANLHVTYFGNSDGTHEGRHPETLSTLRWLAGQGVKSVLVVPVGLATDHLWTAYTLDIHLRRELADSGISYFEVASAVNCHPRFIQALADVVADRLRIDGDRDRSYSAASGARTDRGTGANGDFQVHSSGDSDSLRIPPRNWNDDRVRGSQGFAI